MLAYPTVVTRGARSAYKNRSSPIPAVAPDALHLKVANCAAVVAIDLISQRINRLELFFASPPVGEPHANLLAVQLAVEVHHVSLHRHFKLAPECRFVADVRDRLAPGSFNKRQCDIHAVSRNHRVVRLQIRSRVSKLSFADLAPFDNAALDAVRPAQHSPHQVDAPRAQQPPDHRRAYAVIVDEHFGNLFRNAAEPFGDAAQKLESTFTIVSKREALTEIDLPRVQSAEDEPDQKILSA